jgi:hypothetical protein
MDKNKLIQQIYSRLARLEESREESRIADIDCSHIDREMNELRFKLKELMNSSCPVVLDKMFN